MQLGKCRKHGETEFRKAGAKFKCKLCDNERNRAKAPANHAKRMLVRNHIVAEFGGACIRCGYDKCTAALHFHHRDAAEKSFQIASREMWRPLEAIIAEALKCDLICANCHYELHLTDGTMGPRPVSV